MVYNPHSKILSKYLTIRDIGLFKENVVIPMNLVKIKVSFVACFVSDLD